MMRMECELKEVCIGSGETTVEIETGNTLINTNKHMKLV